MSKIDVLPKLTCWRAGRLADYLEALPSHETIKFAGEWWTAEGNP